MASGWFGGRAIELVKARSLFVRVHPTPANLSERRAVLHALMRYGQIEIFKRLPNPETFVCAPTKSEVASELVSRSPFTFRFVSETLDSIEAKSLPGISPVGVASPIQVHEDKARPPRPGGEAQSDLVKTFTLHIDPSQSYYEHKTNIRLSPIHGPWPKRPEEDQDFAYFALREALPDSIAREGLCDWQTGGQLSDEPASIRQHNAHSNLWHIRERQLRKKQRMELEEGGGGGGGGGGLVALKGLAAPGRQPAGQEGPEDDDDNHTPTPGGNVVEEGEKARDHQGGQQQAAPDPFAEMERLARREDDEAPAPGRKVPPWVRRKQVKLNPLADGRHPKVNKKMPIPDPKSAGRWYEFKHVYNSQMDNVKLPPIGQLEDKR